MMRRFRDCLVSAFCLMIVDHDDRPDNVSFLDSRFEIRDEGSHSCLQKLWICRRTRSGEKPCQRPQGVPEGGTCWFWLVSQSLVSHTSTWYYWEHRTPRKVLSR